MSIFKFDEPELEPKRATKYSAGYDVRSRVTVVLEPGQTMIVPTGSYIDASDQGWFNLRDGHYFGLHIRSSMANKGLRLMNGVGVIDMDYDKEIGVMLENTSDAPMAIKKYDRIAQLVLNRCLMLEYSADGKRTGGFGSTGE